MSPKLLGAVNNLRFRVKLPIYGWQAASQILNMPSFIQGVAAGIAERWESKGNSQIIFVAQGMQH